ncbi:hypothetical protein K504DRAFT_459586 [Pleomassaria siparia CBS 279.74]|uniref:Ras guanyl-nucleotide exchange factor RasGEF n=1 Tax=Pleomassaria siparia CBS 279.74 TaxID=1314801 RepID=A0A6G1K102_9PLEO|nr:hypothetical protein K504DRAFT_459586 [Pleomassaria siparia CBS 279.74]
MSTQTRPQILSLYRRILRELPTRAVLSSSSTSSTSATSHQKLSAPSPLQKRVRDSFTNPRTSNAKSQLHQAEQFVQYIQAQRMYATLIERYNPGMGMSEEERVRLTARKVGMNLPVEFVLGKE